MGKAPSAPNPTTTIQQQTASNKETAVSQAGLNMVNQTDAMGNKLEYTQIGKWADGTPRYASTQTLSGTGQQLFNTGVKTQQNLANLAQDQSGRLSSLLNKNIDLSGLPQGGVAPSYTRYGSGPQLQTSLGADDFSADRQRVEAAMFDRLNPQLDRQRQQLETDLVNRGIRPGSAAYSSAINDFNKGINDQRTSILLNAGQEQNRLQQLAMNAGNFSNTANQQMYANNMGSTAANNSLLDQRFANQNTQRQNALQELIMQRQMPLNEILALSGGSQLQSPQFGSTPQTSVAGVDTAGITNNAFNQQMAGYNAGQQQLGGLFSAGASLIPLLSDERIKTNLNIIGKHPVGVDIYEYDRLDTGEHEIGVIAQHLEKIRPDLVDSTYEDGLKRVWYGKLNQEFPYVAN